MPENRPLHAGDPTSIGGYRLTGRLGKGGQGTVYLGTGADGGRVAVKVLDAEWVESADLRRRFEREAAAARRVASFCTAQVLDADFASAQPYIVSEYVEGPSLKEQVDRHGPRAGADLHRLAVATATALVAVHEAGIVHRDFKPANVLMAGEGPRVIDFGIAQSSDVTGAQTQSVIGTPGYMAPEQISGERLTASADVFAWGAVMVFAATGKAPFTGDSVPAVIHKVMTIEPDLRHLPEPWQSLLGACLAKDPADRPSSDALLMRLLGRREAAAGPPAPTAPARATAPEAAAQGGPPAAAPPDDADHRGGRRRGAGVRLAVIGAALAVVAAVGGGAALAATGGLPFLADAEKPPAAAAPSPPAKPSPEPSKGQPRKDAPESGPAKADTTAKSEGEKKAKDDGEKPTGQKVEGGGNADKFVFTEPFAGRWTGAGTFPNQTERRYDIVIEKGSSTAALTTSDNACTWTFKMFRTNDKHGLDGSVTSGAGCGPQTGGGIWIEGGRLVVMLWGGKDGEFPEHFFWLDRP
ncbi:serine/threonine protein kinase [Murinocardiopsis flavida]|uniref:Serine/threonine protein kinase n=1 Tax=Murinocardiopsis flavida TaxID=645275 RepID=A0A2P8CGT0_9ACTN|nr:serine/threonine-protein kinase [Murinocardiopsis flavida]PSK84195.1 serine/threonine protein kinase [Murinocardiopsis flavida]